MIQIQNEGSVDDLIKKQRKAHRRIQKQTELLALKLELYKRQKHIVQLITKKTKKGTL